MVVKGRQHLRKRRKIEKRSLKEPSWERMESRGYVKNIYFFFFFFSLLLKESLFRFEEVADRRERKEEEEKEEERMKSLTS